MRVIELTKGKACIVDDSDFEELAQYRWYCGNHGYAERSEKMVGGVRAKNVLMHRKIMGFPDVKVDHINGNPLDNRRQNLRLASDTENGCNKRVSKRNKSGLKGVSFDDRKNKFVASICINGKRTWLGYHATPESAHAAYCEAAKELHKDFARFN